MYRKRSNVMADEMDGGIKERRSKRLFVILYV